MNGEILCVMSPRLVRLTRMTMDGNGKKVLLFLLKIRGKAIEMKKIIYLFGWICVCVEKKATGRDWSKKTKKKMVLVIGKEFFVLFGWNWASQKTTKNGKKEKTHFWTWWKELCVYFCCVCSIFG
jgi:SNF family Na+-dependent transporter